jgi:glycosyltransferase involved in cell wall biosynthesis
VRTIGSNTKSKKPFRIGIWCDYGFTIIPNEGIGIFIDNLITGLLAQSETLEVVVSVNPGDQDNAQSYRCWGHPRLSFYSIQKSHYPGRRRGVAFLQAWVRRSDALHGRYEILRHWFHRTRSAARNEAVRLLERLMKQSGARRIMALSLVALLCPFLFLLAWLAYAVRHFTATAFRALAFPLLLGDRAIRRWHRARTAVPDYSSYVLETVRQADCDVWVIPQLRFRHPLNFPSVLFIHDLVFSHFPEKFDRQYVEESTTLARLRSSEATICTCMSAFIRDTDLLGELRLPPDKVRMVPAAPPADFPEVTDEEAKRELPTGLSRPFLFLPSAFRPHKNHAGLLEAFHLLREKHEEKGYDLVFTGEAAGILPDHLRPIVERHSLQPYIHVLGRVERKTLAALFKNAAAVIVPTLYEECSFPVWEALHWNTPIACSRIPAHLELCQPMGDAMIYFDPANPDSIARAILHLRDHRDSVRTLQWHSSRAIWQRTWTDVAREFLPVFKEAAERAQQSNLIHQEEQRSPLAGAA